MPNPPFIIFADARTGSTTLADVLRDFTGQLVSEPFNGRHGSFGRTEAGVKHLLQWLVDRNAGAKHLSAHLNLPNNALLLGDRRARIIFLQRRNVLQQAVSWLLSAGADDWHDPARAAEAARRTTLDILKLHHLISGILGRRAVFGSICARRDNVLAVNYEDIYYHHAQETLNEMLAFLDLPPVEANNPGLLKITEGERVTPIDTYRLIQNINEVDAIFSGDVLGRLFEK
ncbi:MAG: hypothetical protein FJW79_05645 [Actinobacteria bacterium]|nr:hypothetical protein [Actinomycetota bacterium]